MHIVHIMHLTVQVLVVLLLAAATSGQKRKPIVTSLNAKWGNTPLVLEAAEFLATESPDYFWSFVTALGREGSLLTRPAREQQELVLATAGRSLPPSQIDILKFSLGLRTESPKVEMHSHLATDRGVPALGCDAVYDHGGKLSCSLPTVIKADAERAVTYDSDHIYPGTDSTAPLVILYGEVGSAALASAHTALAALAMEGKVTYVLRHFVNRKLEGRVRLSGYGVELQIKSTEYKAQDDSELKGEGGDGGEGDVEEGEVEGFVFSTLKAQHPTKVEKLGELKQHLLDMNNDMAPMKVWQLQDLSTQAAQRVMASPPEDRLKVMADLASNFPSLARSLSRTSVPKELKKEVKKNSDIFYSSLNVQPNDAALFINGQHFDMEFSDIFTILDSIRMEERVLGGLGALGLDSKQTQALMSLDLGGKQQTYGVDVRDSAVNWINDIETDKLYKGWPDGVQELLRPTFPGMLRSIRKNFFNVVVMCDPSLAATKPILKLVESFYVHRAPTRIGIVFSLSTDLERTGENDAGVALLNAFNYISGSKEPYDALAFITDVYSKGEDDEDVTVADVRETFMDSYGADVKLDDVFGEDSEYDVGRTLAEDFIIRSGLGSLPQVGQGQCRGQALCRVLRLGRIGRKSHRMDCRGTI
jgi:UDP-glucose:glycoprotein glucosyltransferase